MTGAPVLNACPHILLSERDKAGEWHTVGEPLPGADFIKQALAYDFAERENKRRFGRVFDWATDPDRAWVAVRRGRRCGIK